jgi:hypothetical protein
MLRDMSEFLITSLPFTANGLQFLPQGYSVTQHGSMQTFIDAYDAVTLER